MNELEAFGALDLRVGRILSAEPLAGARKPAYKLSIDLGPVGVKGSRGHHLGGGLGRDAAIDRQRDRTGTGAVPRGIIDHAAQRRDLRQLRRQEPLSSEHLT